MSRWDLFWNQIIFAIALLVNWLRIENGDMARLVICIISICMIFANWLEFKMKNKWEK